MVKDPLEMEVEPQASSPEVKLWSAVVALAIKDICTQPQKEDRKRKIKEPISLEARSAFRFLLTPQSDWVFEALDINPVAFRERIYVLMEGDNGIEWRYARINHQRYWKLIYEEEYKGD